MSEEVHLEELVRRLLEQSDLDPETLLLLLSAGSLLGIVSLLGRSWPHASVTQPEARATVVNFRPGLASGRREEKRKGEGPVVRWGRRAETGGTAAGPAETGGEEGIKRGEGVF